jgi:hypothetical protein
MSSPSTILILLIALSNLATWFVGMITHGDEEMTEVLEEWENIDDAEPILDFDKIKYQQFLLDNLDLEEE